MLTNALQASSSSFAAATRLQNKHHRAPRSKLTAGGRRGGVTTSVFMEQQKGASGGHHTAADSSYAWAREDQSKSLEAAGRDAAASRVDDILISAHPHENDGVGASSTYDWAGADQRVALRNNALHANLDEAFEDCGVSWLDADDLGVGTGFCVDSINSALSLLKHADAAETATVVRTLIQAGGSQASSAIAAWCELNPNFMPHAGVVRTAVAEYDKEVLRRTVNRANDVVNSPAKDDDEFMNFGVPLSTFFPIDLR